MTLANLSILQTNLINEPYSVAVHLALSQRLKSLRYPDLAAGYAYKALLLIDEVLEDSGEYHEQAFEAAQNFLKSPGDDLADAVAGLTLQDKGSEQPKGISNDRIMALASGPWREIAYRLLVQALIDCGCLRSAMDLCSRGLQTLKDVPNVDSSKLEELAVLMQQKACCHLKEKDGTVDFESLPTSEWPEQSYVRRELYPWNDYEPDRLSEASLQTMNLEMHKVAPKLEVRVTELPVLSPDHNNSDQRGLTRFWRHLSACTYYSSCGFVILTIHGNLSASENTSTIKQLGVFASEDLAPGEIILDETSVLTANNRLNDTLCDACSSDLPELNSITATNTVSCAECDTAIFCSQQCHDLAQATYHAALCNRSVESIAKDVAPTEAASALYTLLLLRTLAMAETQDVHPLDLPEVKYIWGDFTNHPLPPDSASTTTTTTAPSPSSSSPSPPSSSSDPFHHHPRTLPFTFAANILLPLHMLSQLDIDPFAHAARYDVWVFNTLYAKFRGTASARLTGARGRGSVARGPEVGAVHPSWCLANHSCDPNVGWEWGGSVRFVVRGERKRWTRRRRGKDKNKAGIRKGEEILGHYCDVDLPVHDRREWAAGALGGHCLCERCKWESHETDV
ncbi:hypothetical protein EV356DRAFT_446797 [Viridothelium virens]|uniref:MYND-type domain-containing protein n=1 Tax=Viridothelium virens TaxID=1048519 RepID=A0A6A6H8F4_VIRVR|nr:hypothetical protein EV356DRAFT_446797 [Viridothelium virens]